MVERSHMDWQLNIVGNCGFTTHLILRSTFCSYGLPLSSARLPLSRSRSLSLTTSHLSRCVRRRQSGIPFAHFYHFISTLIRMFTIFYICNMTKSKNISNTHIITIYDTYEVSIYRRVAEKRTSHIYASARHPKHVRLAFERFIFYFIFDSDSFVFFFVVAVVLSQKYEPKR